MYEYEHRDLKVLMFDSGRPMSAEREARALNCSYGEL